MGTASVGAEHLGGRRGARGSAIGRKPPGLHTGPPGVFRSTAMPKVTPWGRQPPKTGTSLTLGSCPHMPIYYTASIQHACLPALS